MSLSDNVSTQACNFPSNLFISLMVTRAHLRLSAPAAVILLRHHGVVDAEKKTLIRTLSVRMLLLLYLLMILNLFG